MNKVLSIIFGLILILSVVNAVTIAGENYYSLCQCETQKQQYTVCANTSGTYAISLEGVASKWFSIAPKSVYINAGSCETFYAFITPECYATADNYRVVMKVNGLESAQMNLNVDVKQCHTFVYDISPSSRTVKPCEEASYDLYVKNTGKFVDEFVLTQVGVNDSWINFPREKFVLKAGEELVSKVTMKSTCNTKPSSFESRIKLSNTQTNAYSSDTAAMTVTGYIPFESSFSSSGIKVNSCSETGNDYNFTIKNISTVNDEYTLAISDSSVLSLSQSKVLLKPQESATITLSIKEVSVQKANPILKVTSLAYEETYSQSFELNIENCYELDLDKISNMEESCFNSTEHLFTLKNLGSKDVNAYVSVEGIESQGRYIFVGAKANRDFYLTFDPASVGDKNVVVTAKMDYASASEEFSFEVMNCYDMQVTVPIVNVCPESTSSDYVVFKNNGVRDQTVNININASWVSFEKNKVIVPAGKEVKVKFAMNVPSVVDSKYLLKLISYSPGLDGNIVKAVLREEDISREMSVVMNDLNKCYSFEANYTTQYLDINCCQGKTVDLNITNTGFLDQEINLKKIAPEWVDFSDEEISLSSGESKTVYVYFHPPAGTNGNILSKIELKNQKAISKVITHDLNVYGGNCGLAYAIDLNVNNSVSQSTDFVRREVVVDFVVANDSNYGFNISKVYVEDYNSKADFNTALFLAPGESTTVKLTVLFPEGAVIEDKNVSVVVETSAGTFKKNQLVRFTQAGTQDFSITGFFSEYVAPVAGLVILLILLVVIVAFALAQPKRK